MGVPLGEAHQAKGVHNSGMLICTRNDSWRFRRDMSGSQALQGDLGLSRDASSPKGLSAVYLSYRWARDHNSVSLLGGLKQSRSKPI